MPDPWAEGLGLVHPPLWASPYSFAKGQSGQERSPPRLFWGAVLSGGPLLVGLWCSLQPLSWMGPRSAHHPAVIHPRCQGAPGPTTHLSPHRTNPAFCGSAFFDTPQATALACPQQSAHPCLPSPISRVPPSGPVLWPATAPLRTSTAQQLRGRSKAPDPTGPAPRLRSGL